jgi:hypothetical protein
LRDLRTSLFHQLVKLTAQVEQISLSHIILRTRRFYEQYQYLQVQQVMG